MNIYSVLRALRRRLNDARGVGRQIARTVSPEALPAVRLPTMNEWWDLTSRFPEFRAPSFTALKDFGYMAVMNELRHLPDGARVLEFGHGFNRTILASFDALEVWGVDDYLPLPYNPSEEEWEREYASLKESCPRARFLRGTLGTDNTPDLPREYFDVVFSVSVLEELHIADVRKLLRHAHSLLREGGLLINTHDWRTRNVGRYRKYLKAHEEVGFNLGDLTEGDPEFDLDDLLLESPTVAMNIYQGSEGEHRTYRGHWTTILTIAEKKTSE